MNLQPLSCFCAVLALLAPGAAPTRIVNGLPPQVRSVHLENARTCAQVGGRLEIKPNYVWRTDFNGDGKIDYVLDQHALYCDGAASIYGGSAGLWYNIFVSSGGRYVQQDVIGENGKLVRRGKQMVFSLAVQDGTTSYCSWSGKTLACTK